MSGFTPGPWSFEAVCFDRRIPIRGGVTAYGRPYTIAHVNRPGSAYAGQDKANARLIAAAPELLKALKELCGNAEVARAHIHGVPELSSALFDTIGQARDALAKAEA